MDKRRTAELRGKAQMLRATVHVGKEGLSSSVLEELERQLKKAKLVKVRFLRSVEGDRKTAAEELAARTSSTLVETRGRTVVLAKE
ncbi:MAG: YhbY family RNA-binding protein [Thermoplasmata archaeon]